MSLKDRLKDFLNVYDDAQDFTDEIQKILGKITPLVTTLEKANKSVLNNIEAAKRANNEKAVGRILDQIDVRRPLLLGKSIHSKLLEALKRLTLLERKLRKAPTEVQSVVGPKIQAAKSSIAQAVVKYRAAIEQISELQELKKSSTRGKILAGLGFLAGAAAVGGTMYLVGYAARVAVMRVATSVVMRMTQITIQNLGEVAQKVSAEKDKLNQEIQDLETD